jgi:phosphate/sulfate permease
VLDGEVRVARGTPEGRSIELYRVGPGEVCLLSTSCAFSSRLQSAHATASVPTRLWPAPPEVFLRWMAHPGFREYVFGVFGDRLADDRRQVLKSLAGQLTKPVEYVPEWVVMGVALCLGIGTMFGWERIVVTVGEKIGKTHLTYAQGGAAELVAASTIAMADSLGMPVSTTHVLSSGVAGTMWANKSGIQPETVREIALAWILTLPVAMALSGGLYWVATLFTG